MDKQRVAKRLEPRPCPTCQTEVRLVNPEWLRWVRQRAGLSCDALGVKLGRSGAFISMLEAGKRRVTPEVEAAYSALEKPL